VFNPHKWLLVNFDCSAYFVRDRAALLRSFGASAEILKAAQDDRVVNYRDWGIQLGRRFRALKLWFVIRTYGVDGLRAMLREHIRLGKLFAEWVDADPGFERMAEAPLATVCFRHLGERRAKSEERRGTGEEERVLNELNERLLARINATRELFLTGTRLRGKYALRLALGHLTTTEAQVREAWELIQEVARRR
jgi:aromatic-L-amino-acid decarboxylase